MSESLDQISEEVVKLKTCGHLRVLLMVRQLQTLYEGTSNLIPNKNI